MKTVNDWHEEMRRLKAHIKDAVRLAKKHPGLIQRLDLGDDMLLDVLIDQGNTHLQISRPNEYPPMAVLWAVLEHWPVSVEWANPSITVQSGRKYLTAKWATLVNTGDLN